VSEDYDSIEVEIKPEPEVRPDVVLDPEDRHTEGVDSPPVESLAKPEEASPDSGKAAPASSAKEGKK
jgi:hypothetical protein